MTRYQRVKVGKHTRHSIDKYLSCLASDLGRKNIVDLDRVVEQVPLMKEERTEWLRKWATLVVSTLALLIACLREPLTLTLKATVQDMMRKELGNYETVSDSQARWQKHQDCTADSLKRFERELSALRDLATAGETHGKLLTEVNKRLSSLESKLEGLRREP